VERDGDFAAYAAARWGALVRSAVFLGCSPEEAEDLVQTTLLRCYVSWRTVERADNRDAYVYRMLLNAQRDSRRRRWWGERPTDVLPDGEPVGDAAEAHAVADAVHRALGDLTKASREVVVLRYFARLSEQQTAQVLGIPPGTVKSRLSRALAHLADNTHLTDLAGGTCDA
jgi:RNA polymerase sigma-70 factor (sigma-E family)